MQDISKRVTRVVSEQLGVEESAVTPDKNLFTDLGADSLDAIELSMEVEDEFGIEVPDDVFESFTTVQSVISYLESLPK